MRYLSAKEAAEICSLFFFRIRTFCLSNQQAVPITVEAILFFDGMVIGIQDIFAAGEGADKGE